MTKLAPDWMDALNTDEIIRSFFYEETVCVKECPDEKNMNLIDLCPKNSEANGADYASRCEGKKTIGTTNLLGLCWPHTSDFTEDQKENWKTVIGLIEKNPYFQQFLNLQTA